MEEKRLDITVNKEKAALIFNALHALYEQGDSEQKKRIIDSDILDVFNFVNLYFQVDEKEE